MGKWTSTDMHWEMLTYWRSLNALVICPKLSWKAVGKMWPCVRVDLVNIARLAPNVARVAVLGAWPSHSILTLSKFSSSCFKFNTLTGEFRSITIAIILLWKEQLWEFVRTSHTHIRVHVYATVSRNSKQTIAPQNAIARKGLWHPVSIHDGLGHNIHGSGTRHSIWWHQDSHQKCVWDRDWGRQVMRNL